MDEMDSMMSSCRCDYAVTLCAKDEEDLSVELETGVSLQPDSFRQDSLVLSTCSTETSSLYKYNKTLELAMHVDDGSNVCLVITEGVLHNVVPHEGITICKD